MIDPPRITQSPSQITAIIRLTVPRNEIKTVMGPGIAELMAVIAAQNIAPAGALFSHHLAMHPDTFDFEIGVPVLQAVSPEGRVQPGRLPATRVARTVYHGAYEGLGAAWKEFHAWITTAGHAPGPDLWEAYVAGPESNPDPATWRTQLNRPLIG